MDKDLGKDVDTLKEDISRLKDDLASIAETLLEKGKVETDAAKEKLGERFGDELEAARVKGKEQMESIEDQIREKPLMSLLIAFVIGLFLGKLLDLR
jgi:ElaB/YqjD/DUF883 family membrane-anchored ribosome-binding protein